MTDSSMLKELRQLLETENIPQETVQRLTLSALASVLDKLEILRVEREAFYKRYDTEHINLVDANRMQSYQLNQMGKILDTRISQVGNTLTEMNGRLDCLEKKSDEQGEILTNLCLPNPVISIGCWIKNHPKISGAVFVLFMILMNIWFIPEFRHIVLVMLGVPGEVIDIIAPIVTVTPP